MDPAVKALEVRQDEIMRKLYELKAAVEGLAKTVTTPDADLDLTVSSSLSTQSFSSTTFKGATDLNTLLGKVRNREQYVCALGTLQLHTDSVFLFLACETQQLCLHFALWQLQYIDVFLNHTRRICLSSEVIKQKTCTTCFNWNLS